MGITALLFIGILVGTNSSLENQRYADSVDNFVDLLRNVYSEVSNPQSGGSGDSDKAIYGKFVSFGQSMNLAGGGNDKGIYVYDIVGDVKGDFGDGSIQSALKNLGASMVAKKRVKLANHNIEETFAAAGIVDDYTPKWNTRIEGLEKGKRIKLSIAVVRHPRSGTINTLVWQNNTFEVNDILKDASNYIVIYGPAGNVISGQTGAFGSTVNNFIKTVSDTWPSFGFSEVNFCVNPFSDSSRRQNVRIIKDARNASGVELIGLDDPNNVCNK